MSNIEDIKNWLTEGLPIVVEWNTGGYTINEHINIVKSGCRVIPAVKFAILQQQITTGNTTLSKQAYLGALTPENLKYLQDNQLPVCIRTDNITSMLTQLPRQPLVMDNLSKSAVVWDITSSGTLNDEGLADNFAPASIWTDVGNRWAKTDYMLTIQSILPNIPYYMLSENNEGPDDSLSRYCNITTNNNDVLNLILTYAWKTPDQLKAASLRVYNYYNNPSGTPTIDQFLTQWNANWVSQYNALYNGFDSALSTWKGKGVYDAYAVAGTDASNGTIKWSSQYDNQLNYYNGGGGQMYSVGNQLANFTSPDFFALYNCIPKFEQAERTYPGKKFREMFVEITDMSSLASYKNGIHEIISPELFQGYIGWMMWSLHEPTVPLAIKRWTYSTIKPNDKFFSADNQAYLISVGRADLINTTQNDYLVGMAGAGDEICNDPVIRNFWKNGKPVITGKHPSTELRYFSNSVFNTFPSLGNDTRWRLLEVDINTPRSAYVRPPVINGRGGYNAISIKVWSAAVQIGDDYLVYLWTPCKLSGNITFTLPNVGNFTVPAPAYRSYYVVSSGKLFTLSDYKVFISKKSITINWIPSPSSWAKQSISIVGDDVNISQEIPNTQNSFTTLLTNNKTYTVTVTAFGDNSSSISMTFNVGNKVPAPPSQIYIA